MAIEVPQNKEISGREKNENESVPPSVGEKRIRVAYTLTKGSEEELFREILTLHNQSRDQVKKERRYKVQRKISPA